MILTSFLARSGRNGNARYPGQLVGWSLYRPEGRVAVDRLGIEGLLPVFEEKTAAGNQSKCLVRGEAGIWGPGDVRRLD